MKLKDTNTRQPVFNQNVEFKDPEKIQYANDEKKPPKATSKTLQKKQDKL